MKKLVIVESPAKANTIKKMLGRNTKVIASVGNVRDLPKSKLGVDVDHNFEPRYITIRGKGPIVQELKKEAKKADAVYLATDPDREGEAISWHLAHILNLDNEEENRIEFKEITKDAVRNAMKSPRKLNLDLVDAQQGRRILDRLVGYKITPILWKKIKSGLSAGRVQSVALKIICDREKEIEDFVPEEYWSLSVDLKKEKESFTADYYGEQVKGKAKKAKLKNEEQVDKIVSQLTDNYRVNEVKEGKKRRNPNGPFTTSTLQQEASRKLGFSVKKTMTIAQTLYEGVRIKGEGTVGIISYMRTDSTRVSDEAKKDVTAFIGKKLNKKYINTNRKYDKKKDIQDAHECIRPTSSFRTPEKVEADLSKDEFRLYKLIWQRFVASQMSSAIFKTLSVKVLNGKHEFRTSGSILIFDGFLAVYDYDKEKNKILPPLEENDDLKFVKLDKQQHFTQPPARYTEASLVKTMEDLGIGRPSTYAPTINTILGRYYVVLDDKRFVPTELGITVNNVLVENFSQIIDEEFTAEMEDQLDLIAEGDKEWKTVIADFYGPFEELLDKAEKNIEEIELQDEVTDEICEKCGKPIVIKMGRFGKFLGCSGFPECKFTKSLDETIGMACPNCEDGEVVVRRTKKGRKFYGCSEYPDCDFRSWKNPKPKEDKQK